MEQKKIIVKDAARMLYQRIKGVTNSIHAAGVRENDTIVVYLEWDVNVPDDFLGYTVVKEITGPSFSL